MNDLFERAKKIGLRHIKDWLPFGKTEGREWFVLNPMRADKTIGSFSINLDTGAFLDRASQDKGGDSISLYAFLNNLRQGEAAKKILENYDSEYFPGQYNTKKHNSNWQEWYQVENGIKDPPPLDTEWYQMKWGKEIERWELKNSQNNIVMYIVRFMPADGKKNDRPFSLWSGGGKYKWRSKALTCKYPLWGLQELLNRPNDPVLLVEGQKAASRAHKIIGDKFVCVGWYGGSQAIKKIDIDILVGRVVYFWPDADSAGRAVIKKIKELNLNLKIIINPANVKKGWDVADAIIEGWSREKIIAWIESAQPAIDTKMLQEYNRTLIEGKPFIKLVLNKMANSQPGDSFTAWMVAEKLKDNFLYDCEKKYWYKYDKKNHVWKPDIENLTTEIARTTILSLFSIAAIIPAEGERNQWIRFATRSDKIFRIRAALILCESFPDLVVRHKHWNQHTELMNVKNGCINLETMKFQESKKEYYFTKQANVIYDKDAKFPLWNKFINEIFDKDTAKYMQKIVGLCMTVEMKEQKFWCLHGTGNNGKGVLINILFHILDDYALGVDVDVLMESKSDGNAPKPGIVKMIGRRLIVATENEIGQALNQGLIKQITGCDTIQARDLNRPPIEFKPVCKIFIVTNHKPRATAGGYSLWRRLRLIPFKITIPEERIDKELVQKLKKESSGILNWMLEGLRKYKEEGLEDIDVIAEATTKYKESQDVIGEFLKENEEIYKSGTLPFNKKIPARELYSKYTDWCKETGEHTLSQRIFKLAMQERGYRYYQTDDGKYYELIKNEEEIPF